MTWSFLSIEITVRRVSSPITLLSSIYRRKFDYVLINIMTGNKPVMVNNIKDILENFYTEKLSFLERK